MAISFCSSFRLLITAEYAISYMLTVTLARKKRKISYIKNKKNGLFVFYCSFDSLDYALVYAFFIWKNAAVASIKPIQISSNPMTGITAPMSTNSPAVPNKPTPDFADN